MPDIAIRVENLSKLYKIGVRQQGYKTLRESIMGTLAAPFQRLKRLSKSTSRGQQSTVNGQQSVDSLWALKDVSFEVKRGEVMGIIGGNGAGKTTLLKILSRITEPTEGKAEIHGRVGSLLEVGTGFHPELTGRENVYLNGAILGMRKAEIERKFDEIIDFAEIEKFMDTPVKRYSSGMYVRLAFAVAAHLEPEILLVDEVLAVGDASFQKKCLGKMGDVAKEGRTVLFVSHNMGAIRSLCARCILLVEGEWVMDDDPSQVISYYLSSGIDDDNAEGEIYWPRADGPGGEEMKLCGIRLLGPTGDVQGNFEVDKPITVEITYVVIKKLRGMRLILRLLTQEGIIAFDTTDHYQRQGEVEVGRYVATCTIPKELLNRGKYLVYVHAGIPGVKVLVPGREFLSLTTIGIESHGSHFPENWFGVVCPRLEWTDRKIE
jgi:lipopolysaccharide transport system ATP-binding protein